MTYEAFISPVESASGIKISQLSPAYQRWSRDRWELEQLTGDLWLFDSWGHRPAPVSPKDWLLFWRHQYQHWNMLYRQNPALKLFILRKLKESL